MCSSRSSPIEVGILVGGLVVKPSARPNFQRCFWSGRLDAWPSVDTLEVHIFIVAHLNMLTYMHTRIYTYLHNHLDRHIDTYIDIHISLRIFQESDTSPVCCRRERRLLGGISTASLFQAVTIIICMHSTYMYLLLTAKQYYGWFHPEHHLSFFFPSRFCGGTPPRRTTNPITELRRVFFIARRIF